MHSRPGKETIQRYVVFHDSNKEDKWAKKGSETEAYLKQQMKLLNALRVVEKDAEKAGIKIDYKEILKIKNAIDHAKKER